MRAYAKVCLGLQFLLDLRAKPCLWFFEPGTKQEAAVAQEIAIALGQYPDASASVSVECHGAMRDYPVIGTFPLPEPRDRGMSRNQRRILDTMIDGAPMLFEYRGILIGRALLKRGYLERVSGMPTDKWWLVITEAGRAKMAEGQSAEGMAA